jgi:CHAT domain
VAIRQEGPIPLVTLALKPEFLAEGVDISSELVVTGGAPLGPRRPLPATLRIFEDQQSGGMVYTYVLSLPDRELETKVKSPLIERPREQYVQSLYQRIEDVWVNSNEDIDQFQEDLRSYGGDLLDELFPPDLQQLLWDLRDALDQIVVLSTEPFVPWELVHLKDPSHRRLPDETRFLAQLGLVRWLWASQEGQQRNAWLPEKLRLRPGRARFIIPDYPDENLRLTETTTERRFLEEELGATAVVPHHRQVIDLLRTPDEFDLLHFAGHGRATSEDITDAQILLQGRMQKVLRGKQLVEVYRQEPLRAVSVRQNFLVPDDTMTRPIVVLNACQSGRLGYQLSSIGGFAEAFVGKGAAAFVGSLWSVGDSPASTFVQTFYEELLAGQTVASAVRTAREHARDSGDATWLAYTVYAHPEARLHRT